MAATPQHAARVLGLDLDATLDDVRRVRRRMALKYHPDRASDTAQANRHMARINAAADTLIAHIEKRPAERARQAARRDARAGNARRARRAAGRETRQEARRETGAQDQGQNRTQDREAAGGAQVPPSAPGRGTSRTGRRTAAEQAMMRRAAASYRNVLERIGGRDAGAPVNATVLGIV